MVRCKDNKLNETKLTAYGHVYSSVVGGDKLSPAQVVQDRGTLSLLSSGDHDTVKPSYDFCSFGAVVATALIIKSN